MPKEILMKGVRLFNEQQKVSMAELVAKIAYKSAKRSANTTCFGPFGQPKLPEKVKKLRNF